MYGILIRESKGRGGKNIGDYIQSIAQRQFIRDKETCYVDIEYLSDFKSDQQVNVIMNGWFTWDCSKFLPPACINPLFVSFHLTPIKEKDFFTKEITEYLKKYQPIGARDMKTTEMMRAHGIDSYYSGCLTMTLGKEYMQDAASHTGDVYVVDPYYEIGGDMSLPHIVRYTKMIWYTIRHFKAAWKLKDKLVRTRHSIIRHISDWVDKIVCAANFYHIYSQRFSDEILFNAKYISAVVSSELPNEEKFAIADKMLRDYANARFVISSRLHVSLPCLALGTKNVFIVPSVKNEDKGVLNFSSRIGGCESMFNLLEYKNGKLVDKANPLPKKISLQNCPSNPDEYLKYAAELEKIVNNFVRNNP